MSGLPAGAGALIRVEVSSRLNAPPARVWADATTPAGINYELGPWLRMTVPRALRGATLDEVPLGRTLGRSWVLLFGLVPIDYDDLFLAARDERSFHERSRTFLLRPWEHERWVDGDGSGAVVRDRVTFELRSGPDRIPGAPRVAAAIVGAIFRHRHRRLRRRFGTAP